PAPASLLGRPPRDAAESRTETAPALSKSLGVALFPRRTLLAPRRALGESCFVESCCPRRELRSPGRHRGRFPGLSEELSPVGSPAHACSEAPAGARARKRPASRSLAERGTAAGNLECRGEAPREANDG